MRAARSRAVYRSGWRAFDDRWRRPAVWKMSTAAVGPSGQLLDKALLSVGITRDHVYVTNIVKCRPKGNRTPAIAEGMNAADGGWRKKYASCSRKLSSLSEKWRSVSFWGMMRVLSVPAAIGLITRASPLCRLSIRHTCSARRERD